MSPQAHPVMQALGGAGEPTATVSIVTVPRVLPLWEVTDGPARTLPVTFTVTLEPAIAVQVTPSLEVYAVNVVPVRPTCRYVGTVPAMVAIDRVFPPPIGRYSTTIVCPGVT